MKQEDFSGLKIQEIDKLRKEYGFNVIAEKQESLWLLWGKQFWSPLAWVLEATALLSLLSGSRIEALIVIVLLIINSIISIAQHTRATEALNRLKQTLKIKVRVIRDGKWIVLDSSDLLPGDIVRLRAGDIVAADMKINDGSLTIDQSKITGESLQVERNQREKIFSGSTIIKGEATATVLAIGAKTVYGTTAELLETSHPPTHMEKIVFLIIKYQFLFNISLIIVFLLIALLLNNTILILIIPLAIVLLLSSVPVAFPAMFSIAQAYGALQMSKINNKGILVRRLASVQDGAMMNMLCLDKTGTLTQNLLTLTEVKNYDNYSIEEVLAIAASCSNSADNDPIDAAILKKAKELNVSLYKQLSFTPFDSLTKRTSSIVDVQGHKQQLYKGLPSILISLATKNVPSSIDNDIKNFSLKGYRVVAVATSDINNKNVQIIGLIALSDPVRSDSKLLLKSIQDLGIKIKMITGDNLETATTIAKQLEFPGGVCHAKDLRDNPKLIYDHSVFAEAFPEDKQLIITALQKVGYIVGMTGDGVNDAPALAQAEVGIAVASATDIAKNSASLILTNPGLSDIVKAIIMSRQVYSRIRTWALNKIVKGFQIAILTSIIFFMTNKLILTPLIVVLLIFANDFVTISIATDYAKADRRPASWRIDKIMISAAMISISLLLLLIGGLYLSIQVWHFSISEIQTETLLLLVFQGQASLYALRSWPHFWQTKPSQTLFLTTVAIWLIFLPIALLGIFVTPIPFVVLPVIVAISILSLIIVDWFKLITPVNN